MVLSLLTSETSNMTKVEVFEIIYDNEQAVYREGDSVTGQVKLETKEDLKVKGKHDIVSMTNERQNGTMHGERAKRDIL